MTELLDKQDEADHLIVLENIHLPDLNIHVNVNKNVHTNVHMNGILNIHMNIYFNNHINVHTKYKCSYEYSS